MESVCFDTNEHYEEKKSHLSFQTQKTVELGPKTVELGPKTHAFLVQNKVSHRTAYKQVFYRNLKQN